MRARKVDGNLSAIVKTARKLGFRVNVRNDELGDLDVQFGCYPPSYRSLARHEVWEVKTEKGKLTDGQKKRTKEGWIIWTIRTADDVMEARRRFV